MHATTQTSVLNCGDSMVRGLLLYKTVTKNKFLADDDADDGDGAGVIQ